jgi:hypothetical protein
MQDTVSSVSVTTEICGLGEKKELTIIQIAEIDLQEAGTPIDEELYAHITNKSTISPDENTIYPILRDPFRKFSRATSCTSGLGR